MFYPQKIHPNCTQKNTPFFFKETDRGYVFDLETEWYFRAWSSIAKTMRPLEILPERLLEISFVIFRAVFIHLQMVNFHGIFMGY